MLPRRCTLELYHAQAWQPVAEVHLSREPSAGVATPTRLAYHFTHALDYDGVRDSRALSACLPVQFDFHEQPHWPAFLVDLLPQGHGRRLLENLHHLTAGPAADWPLLLAGAGNPIGNLRVAEAYVDLRLRSQAYPVGAFARADIVQRADHFMEYLSSHGLYVAGSSGVQGEWPKALLTEAQDGNWHLDHLLPDAQAARHWLVKLSRSGPAIYDDILQAEAAYHALAARLGIRTVGQLQYEQGALFIPRFDREVVEGQVVRHAQESLYSLCGVAGFAQNLTHNRAIAALARYCTQPIAAIVEYVQRDVLNVAFGNKDNHGRNTAIQRRDSGEIVLSPLFDFAPMLLHPDGIARATRWQRGDGGLPDWRLVAEQVAETGLVTVYDMRQHFGQWRAQLADVVPRLLEEFPLPESVSTRVLPLVKEVISALALAEA